MNGDFLETVVGDLESTAYWRREKATEYPSDRRNDTAADILEQLARAIRAEPQSDAVMRLQDLDEKLARRAHTDKNVDFSGLIIECSDYRRRIGFSEFPSSIEQYLATLSALYRGHLSRNTRRRGLVQGADEIRQLRTVAADLRSKVSHGSYGDSELQLFWRLTQSAGLTLKLSNPELSARAGLGHGFFMSVSRDRRSPKLVNFLKALTTIIEVADERLAAIERAAPVSDRRPLRGGGRHAEMEENRDDLLTLARALSRMALDEIRKIDDERLNDPASIESNKKYRELLQIFADGFERIAVALAALENKKPETRLPRKANDIVRSVGVQVNDWLHANGTEIVDWSMRIPFFTAGVAALGWAGADMTVATTAIAAIVGGQKVIDILRQRKEK